MWCPLVQLVEGICSKKNHNTKLIIAAIILNVILFILYEESLSSLDSRFINKIVFTI